MQSTQTVVSPRKLTPRSQPKNQGARRVRGMLAHILSGICTVVAVGLLVYLLVFLILKGISVIDWEFLTSEAAATGEEGGGIAASLYGTFLIVALALVFGLPIGILLGIYLAEVASSKSWFANIARLAVNTFTGVPSILVGLFVYTILVKDRLRVFGDRRWHSAGDYHGTDHRAHRRGCALRLVPGSVREAGLALGVPFWRVTMGIVVPAARAGLITGGVLAVARVAGETAPLILTALGNEFINWDVTKPTDESDAQDFEVCSRPV